MLAWRGIFMGNLDWRGTLTGMLATLAIMSGIIALHILWRYWRKK